MTLLSEGVVRGLLKRYEVSAENRFAVLQTLAHLCNQQEEYSNSTQELVLRALEQRSAFADLAAPLDLLAARAGLFPYIDGRLVKGREAIAREFHTPSVLLDNVQERDSIVFHRAQALVFRKILDGASVILSAPTSFGKSSIIDELIASGRFKNVAIVVPTIALIDETRRRLYRFKDTHKIITHGSQDVADSNVFVFTQERAVEFQSFPALDLFVLDEFYKLDPSADKERATTLNHAFYKLTKKSRQFYLLGPNINHIPEGFPERFRCEFIRTDFTTVVTELTTIKASKGNEESELLKLCSKLTEPTLIYCASPARARKIVNLLSSSLDVRGGGMLDAANWIAENYHPDWTLVRGFEAGIGMHHGRMPRALSQLAVRGFNEGSLRFLVCTSTLIEGVNTKAKNVVIFDNKIATQKYDYFTFNNIRGRSGRMFKHFIGHVYLFHSPPQEELPFVDIPAFTQDVNAPESLLIQMDEEDLRELSRERLAPFRDQAVLSYETLRLNSGVDPDSQIELARYLTTNTGALAAAGWTGLPTYLQLQHLCVLIWDYFVRSNQRIGGASSGRQLALKLNRLRTMSLQELISEESSSTTSVDDAIENVLDFIRQWPQFRFGRFAMAVNRIQNELAIGLNFPRAEYSFFVGQVENLFVDSSINALDEYGIPFPLAKRLEPILDAGGKLDLALARLKQLNLAKLRLTKFERELLLDVQQSI